MAGKGKIENLQPPWKRGQSGNPSGRPRTLPITNRYATVAELPAPDNLLSALPLSEPEKKEIKTYGDALVLSQFRAGIKGKTDAAKEIGDRLEGKARQAVNHGQHQPSRRNGTSLA